MILFIYEVSIILWLLNKEQFSLVKIWFSCNFGQLLSVLGSQLIFLRLRLWLQGAKNTRLRPAPAPQPWLLFEFPTLFSSKRDEIFSPVNVPEDRWEPRKPVVQPKIVRGHKQSNKSFEWNKSLYRCARGLPDWLYIALNGRDLYFPFGGNSFFWEILGEKYDDRKILWYIPREWILSTCYYELQCTSTEGIYNIYTVQYCGSGSTWFQLDWEDPDPDPFSETMKRIWYRSG